ncbi:Nicastrin-like protein [Dinothrombium tinctorium]|uniref:Nicastrin n=1 Tax=Dinothrombium tinctorium TaxID=1965070 RepID=A0A443QY84_9ACAR|nr:Nicastrin-like protein [Dinothrombium tinctorium]
MNATHSIGCQTNSNGNVGIVFVIENDDDLEWVLHKGTSVPYIPALYISYFTKDVLLKLRDSGRISGAILLNSKNSKRPDLGFSPDKTCPNEGFGLYANYPQYSHCTLNEWNPKNPVTDLMFIDWKIPLYLLSDEASIRSLTKCFDEHNKPNGTEPNWPLCAVELNSRMMAAANSPTCIRRSHLPLIPLANPITFCDPISSYNIISTLFPTNEKMIVKNHSLIVVATRLDSLSLFQKKAVGAYSVITTVITLLSVAHTLAANAAKFSKNDKNVLFAFFDGENWDYIGSSRAAYDLKHKSFAPIQDLIPYYKPANFSLEHISHFIELNQISSNQDTIWVHTDPISIKDNYVNQTVTDLIQLFKNKSSNLISINRTNAPIPLPPASLQSFLKEELKIPGIVLSNFEMQYANKYFNSFLDFETQENNETIRFLTNMSTLVANTIISLIDRNQIDVVADETIVKELFNCFLINTSCKLFKELTYDNMPQEITKDTSTSVAGYTNPEKMYEMSAYVSIVLRLLINFTGSVVSHSSKSECMNLMKNNSSFSFTWVGSGDNGSCISSSCFLTAALSPAFLNDSVDWKTTYSTWTESEWKISSARLFLKPSFAHEMSTLFAGIGVFLFSFGIVYIIQEYIIFTLQRNPSFSPVREPTM